MSYQSATFEWRLSPLCLVDVGVQACLHADMGILEDETFDIERIICYKPLRIIAPSAKAKTKLAAAFAARYNSDCDLQERVYLAYRRDTLQ